ncbi:hypothetical protein [Gordonia sp. OPL2]|uniref:hypothetical protein n=1 Tax=Gordonia sp. OPL2 TaxID=2486274 RepID=UPI001655D24B|nr:hypothetical protein [Gordonia sp. OPL2]
MHTQFDLTDDAELLAAVSSADRGERGRALLRLSRRFEARMVMTAYEIGGAMYDEVLHNLDPVRQMTVRHAADKAAVGEISLQLSVSRSKAGRLFNLGAALHGFPKIMASYLAGDHSTHRVGKMVRAAQSVPDTSITDEWIREFAANEAETRDPSADRDSEVGGGDGSSISGGDDGDGKGDGGGGGGGGGDDDIDAEVPATLEDALADARADAESDDRGDCGRGEREGDDSGGGDGTGGDADDASGAGCDPADGSPTVDFEDLALDLASRPTTDTVLGNALDAVVISMDPDRAAEVREEFGRTYQNVIVTTDASGHASIDACVPAEDGLRISRRIATLIHERVCPGDPRTLGQQRVAAFAEITRKRGARLACECGRADCRARVKTGKAAPRVGGGSTSGAAAPERSAVPADVSAHAQNEPFNEPGDDALRTDLGGDAVGGGDLGAADLGAGDLSGGDLGGGDLGGGDLSGDDPSGGDLSSGEPGDSEPHCEQLDRDELANDVPDIHGRMEPGDEADDPDDGGPAGGSGPDDPGPDPEFGGPPGGANCPITPDDEWADPVDDEPASPLTLILDPTLARPPHLRGYGAIDPALAAELAPRATIIGPPSVSSRTRRTSGAIVTDRTPPRPVDATGHGGFDRPPPGALMYAPSAKLRAEVEYSDLTCRYPLCTRPSHECQLDHLVPFNHADPMAGGWTLLDNIIPLCTPDHQRKHLGIWIPVMNVDRTVVWRNAQSGYELTTHPS